MSRGKYAGQPLSFHCPKCFVKGGRQRRASDVTLTGRTRERAHREVTNYHGWSPVAREYRCPCGHVGWSRHPDLGRWAQARQPDRCQACGSAELSLASHDQPQAVCADCGEVQRP